MRVTSLLLLVAPCALALALATGCGGNVDFGIPDASGDDGGADGADAPGDAPASCPTAQPAFGAACTIEGLQCQYASGCPAATLAKCASGKWDVQIPDCPAPAPTCPTTMPTANTACPKVGLECAYGEDPRPQCRPHASCSNSGWQIPIGLCAPAPTLTCPTTAAAAANQACSAEGAYCTYPSGAVCGCGGCLGGPCSMNKTWHCDAPPTTAGCPKTLPNLGTGCLTNGLECDYGSCSAGDIAGRKCDGTVWVDVPMACPA